MRSRKLLSLIVPAVAIACGSHAVDLDAGRTPKLTASNDPTVLGVIDERVTALAVDGQRIYWLGSWLDKTLHAAVRSCEKLDCAHSLVTYDANAAVQAVGFGLRGGEVFWFQTQGANGNDWALQACNVAGCKQGSRTVARASIGAPMAMTLSDDAVYVFTALKDERAFATDSAISKILLDGADASAMPIVKPRGEVVSLTVADEQLYWLEQGMSPVSGYGGNALQRIATEAGSSPQLLADQLAIDGSNTHRLATDQTHVYWSQTTLHGAIARCPLTGCVTTSTPEIFAEPTRAPTSLWLDGSNLYWAHDTAAAGYAIATCRLDACSPTDTVAAGLADSDALATDDAFIYSATRVRVNEPPSDGSVTVQLRLFPKEAR